MGRFSHVSLVIDLDYEPWLPRPAVFLDTASYLPRRACTLVHESIHYWHQLSHGYLLALAEEDWRQLREWESGGRPAPGPLRQRYRQPQGRHGFSPESLCECTARFWEVLFVGARQVLRNAVLEARAKSITGDVPPDLAALAGGGSDDLDDSRTFDMAMTVRGSYGAPFAVVRELMGQAQALAVFPLLAHFALKSADPVQSFEHFLDGAAAALAERADALGLEAGWDQDLATSLFAFAAERCTELARREHGGGGGELRRAADFFAGSALADNPAYRWAFDCLARVSAETGGVAVDLAVGLPVFSDFRRLLATFLAPPCVRFRDGQALALLGGYVADREGAAADVATAEQGAAECLAVQRRWDAFQSDSRGY